MTIAAAPAAAQAQGLFVEGVAAAPEGRESKALLAIETDDSLPLVSRCRRLRSVIRSRTLW